MNQPTDNKKPCVKCGTPTDRMAWSIWVPLCAECAKGLCPKCDGSGTRSTGIAESSYVQCYTCGGSGALEHAND